MNKPDESASADASVAFASSGDLSIRTLRYFVAVAEELHFTRAAARLYVAQQALSRDIARLERQIGTPLFVRTTRRVTLTPAGERLLARARELVALHDLTWREVSDRRRPVVVDLLSEGRQTGLRVLEAAREAAPTVEFRGRYGGGVSSAVARLLSGDLDVAFGRATWTGQRPGRTSARVVRYEPLALVLTEDHPLAQAEAVAVGGLRDVRIDTNPADPNALEWADLSRQLLAFAGAQATEPHVAAIGPVETRHHLLHEGHPILTGIDYVPPRGAVVRPIVDPVPIYVWSIVTRAERPDAGVKALLQAAAALGNAEGWLELPPESWLPLPEAAGRRVRSG